MTIQHGWEERLQEIEEQQLGNVFGFMNVDLDIGNISFPVTNVLTDAELERLEPKLLALAPFIDSLVRGMIKGTIKYDCEAAGSEWIPDEWDTHFDDEFADLVNYRILKRMFAILPH